MAIAHPQSTVTPEVATKGPFVLTPAPLTAPPVAPPPVTVPTVQQQPDLAQAWRTYHQSRNEDVSTSITQTWTEQAMRCYATRAHCASCDIPKGNYQFTCQMNKVVPALLGTLGQPEANRLKKLYPMGLPDEQATS